MTTNNYLEGYKCPKCGSTMVINDGYDDDGTNISNYLNCHCEDCDFSGSENDFDDLDESVEVVNAIISNIQNNLVLGEVELSDGLISEMVYNPEAEDGTILAVKYENGCYDDINALTLEEQEMILDAFNTDSYNPFDEEEVINFLDNLQWKRYSKSDLESLFQDHFNVDSSHKLHNSTVEDCSDIDYSFIWTTQSDDSDDYIDIEIYYLKMRKRNWILITETTLLEYNVNN